MAETQVSALISEHTKQTLEAYVEAHGVKKAHLVEAALLHHLQALTTLPADLVIPPRLMVKPAEMANVVARVAKPGKPTAALRELIAGTPNKRGK